MKYVVQDFRLEIEHDKREKQSEIENIIPAIDSALQIQRQILTEDDDALGIQLSDDSDDDVDNDNNYQRYF